MEPLRVLVVEDELIIALNITDYLRELGYRVVKSVATYEKAIAYLTKENPDIAILDIKIKGDKSGIDIASFIAENLKIPFIFLTSVTDPIIFTQAKNLNPAAYLLKPFTRDDLFTSIELAIHNFQQKPEISDKDNKKGDLDNDSSFIINCNNLFYRIYFKDIVYAKSDHVYTQIATVDGKTHLIRSTMNGLLKLLPDNFLRTHRSYIVNSDFIDKKSAQTIVVQGIEIPVSRSYKLDF